MPDTEGRVIVESSSFEGALEAIECLQCQFYNVTATIPVKTAHGRYISSVYYSNETKTVEITSNVARN